MREDYGSGCQIGEPTCLPTLTKGEPRSDLCGGFVNKITDHFDIVTRHDHFLSSAIGAVWPVEGYSYVGCAQENLGTIVFHEGSVAATLLLREDLEVRALPLEHRQSLS